MSFRPRYLALAVVATLIWPLCASAQQTEARVIGTVSDQSGGVLPGVTVTVTSTTKGTSRTEVTDGDGKFTVTNLEPGRYAVKFELSGFQTTEREITLGVGDTKPVDIGLSVGTVTENVTVSAKVTVLDTSSAKIGVNVAPEEIANLPVNGRNFANLMTLATGATSDGNGGWSSIRFNGKSNQQNYLNYDGVDGTYVFDANPGYLNVTGSQFRLQTSMESVSEFRVNSGLAPAESGLGTGGNITVITKSGGNRFTGSVFEYKRDDALDSASKFDDKKQRLEMDQFGGSIGGPIAKNRTFFFGSFEGLRQTTGLSFTEAIPSLEARRRILAGEPTTTGGGRSPQRTQAVAPLLAGFPTGGVTTNSALLSLFTSDKEAEQREDAFTARIDHTFSDGHSMYARYMYSKGRLDTPDATVTERRILSKQQPQNFVLNFQSILGNNLVNEMKFGFNRPATTAETFGNLPPEQVSLSGVISSGSVDGRSTTGVATSGLQIRQSSAASGGGLLLEPASYAFSDNLTLTTGRHTWKFGGEYRMINVGMNFLGGTTLTYGSINDFIDNRPSQIQVVEDSGDLTAQQYYLIGYAQDTWRPRENLTLDLGIRYEFYSVVKEKDGNARPFIVHEGFVDANDFYEPDYNNIGPRLSATWIPWGDKTVIRGGFGLFYGPGQLEDRLQPIENAITRFRATSSDIPDLQYPFSTASLGSLQAIRAYTREYPHEYNIQYGVSVQRELPADINLSVGYTGSKGRDLFLRGVTNTFTLDPLTGRTVRPFPTISEIDFKTTGGESTFNALQIGATRRFRSGFTGGFQYQLAENKGTSQGSNEAATASNTFDFGTEQGPNLSDVRHTVNASVIYALPFEGALAGGWRVGGIFNGRTGVPINVTINRRDTLGSGTATIVNIPGGNQRGTQRPDLVPGVDPYITAGGRQYLNPAAFATPQPGTFGNAPRNFLNGPGFWQIDLMLSKDIGFGSQALQLRVDMFNITNRLNFANPPASLPNTGAPGVPFSLDPAAGGQFAGPTFGLYTAPLNRTIGFGTARQTQLSIRYLF